VKSEAKRDCKKKHVISYLRGTHCHLGSMFVVPFRENSQIFFSLPVDRIVVLSSEKGGATEAITFTRTLFIALHGMNVYILLRRKLAELCTISHDYRISRGIDL